MRVRVFIVFCISILFPNFSVVLFLDGFSLFKSGFHGPNSVFAYPSTLPFSSLHTAGLSLPFPFLSPPFISMYQITVPVCWMIAWLIWHILPFPISTCRANRLPLDRSFRLCFTIVPLDIPNTLTPQSMYYEKPSLPPLGSRFTRTLRCPHS